MKASNRSQKKLISLCLATGLSLGTGQVLAQEMDHSQMQIAPETSVPAAPKTDATEEKPIPAPTSTDPHAGHGVTMPKQKVPTTQQVDHAAMGHDMPMPVAPTESTDHSKMDHSAMGHDTKPVAQPRTPIPAVTDADRAAAAPPSDGHPAHDNSIHHYLLLDRLEGWDADPGAGTAWAMQGWLGTDLDRLWLRSEGERVDGRTESADLEVLYGRSVAPWWDVVAGVRHDFNPGGSQDFAAIGVMGLAPYMFEVQATAYIGQAGQTAARIEVEYEMLLTNRLILQPVVEVDFYGRNDERRGIGSGLSTAEAGLRLRYEITRQFAPYVGIVREQAFGRTADLRQAEGEDSNDTRVIAGFRIWF